MIEQFIKQIASSLDDRNIPYMIIGGQAVLVHGRPRLTRDVDITLGIDTDRFEQILGVCNELKLSPQPKDPRHFAEETKVLPTEDPSTKLRVDFIFSNTPYEQQAIDRAIKVEMAGYPVKFASAEDLVIHKIFSGRVIDLEDVKAVFLRQRNQLDEVYIRKWLKSFGEAVEDGRDLIAVWNQLYKKAS